MTIKQAIIDEYLVGEISYRELSKKCGFGITTICRWVATYQGRSSSAPYLPKAVVLVDMKQADQADQDSKLPGDIATLQKELVQERLRVKLLTAMIEIAEDELKIPIRKKYGTKPLKK